MEFMNKTNIFKVGELFPIESHYKRIRNYHLNKKIFTGHNHEIYSKAQFSPTHKDLLYISVNLAGLICKKSADFLFGEELKILAGKGENTAEQKAFDRFVEDNHLNIVFYENALTNAYAGDSFIKVRYGQEYAGELPPELDEPKVIIENVNPEYVFPECQQWDRNRIKTFHIAVPFYIEDDDKWVLNVESHSAGKIEYRQFKITPILYDPDHIPERFSIDGENEEARSVVMTGVNMPLVVHVPNLSVADGWEGISDITEIHPLLDEINNRITQISDILDKHSNPAMAVPSGLLSADEDGNAQFRVAVDKVFEVMSKDDVIPQYITWNGQLQEAFTELNKLIEMVLMIAEIPAVALGMGDSGTSGSSGLAIKWRMNSLLAKINRKKQYYNKGIKQVFYIAEKLEEALGIADYEPVVPVLHFQDGLPKDENEQANIMAVRTGGAKTLSQKSAIMILNEFTEEQAEREIERIKAEEEAQQEIADPSFLEETQSSPDPLNNFFNAETPADEISQETEFEN